MAKIRNDTDEIRYEYWLASLISIKKQRRIQAAERAGGAKTLFQMRGGALRSLGVLDDRDIYRICQSRNQWDIMLEWEKLKKLNIDFRCILQNDFPERLRFIPDPPFALFVKGVLPDQLNRSVGIVGARMCSDYGRKIAGLLGERIAAAGMLVVSGMARGIDSASQAGALRAKGQTIAVLGSGCDVCYPKSSARIYENILDGHGAVISEFLPGTQPLPVNFPIRNRIISGLSDVLVVVEAREKSGSLITVDAALEQGKDIYAVPGRYDDMLSRGCNRLIAEGAGILYDIPAFLKEIGSQETEETENEPKILLENENLLVYDCLCLQSKDLMTLQAETRLPLLQLIRILDELKSMGLVEETDRNYYSKKI